VARFLLDTTVLIDVLRGRSAAERLLELSETSEVPFVCAVNIEEVFRGVRKGDVGSVSRLLEGLRVAPLGRVEGEVAGSWRRAFADRGITLSQADCLVAAATVGVGARLVTGNPKDFPMSGLTVEHWPAAL
jgi:predicted nucleic acid-binding protein